MKKTITLVLMFMVITVFSGCTLFQNLVSTKSTTSDELQTVVTTPGTTAVILPGTLPLTTALATDPSTTAVTIAPATTAPKTKPATKPKVTKSPTTKAPISKPRVTKPPATKPLTKPLITKPLTKPVITIPAITKPSATKPRVTKPSVTKPTSNLPSHITSALNRSGNGLVIIYEPQHYENIVAITAWNVTTYDTKSQLLLVTKKKGSLVQVYDTKLIDDQQESVMNDVIRKWTTTQDNEVIRIRYSDPETLTMNFIKVTEPGGKKTTTEIKSSMVGPPDWEAIAYD